MRSNDIVLRNYYIVKSMPKTKAKGFDTIQIGDTIEISLALTWHRAGDNHSLTAYYPLINGVQCAGIPVIQNLMNKGMVLEELSIEDNVEASIKEFLGGFKK